MGSRGAVKVSGRSRGDPQSLKQTLRMEGDPRSHMKGEHQTCCKGVADRGPHREEVGCLGDW